ncbi:hypothetical protein OAM41_02915 [Gammaproteobacteria bacterium]|nr:hypothetical protein [Gammaproteobacteria bacterium]
MRAVKGIVKAFFIGIKLANPKTRNAFIKKELAKLEKRVMA